jgi:hypothetical protein
MITDPYVEKYMRYNNTTKPMFENSALVPMFDMEFAESMATLNNGEYTDAAGKRWLRLFRVVDGKYEYISVREDHKVGADSHAILNTAGGYVKDGRTGKDASYFPILNQWDIAAFNVNCGTPGETLQADTACGTSNEDIVATATGDWKELKIHHCLVIGKDALIRTGMSGQDNAQMYVKPKGSAGVIDPIDQRQSIGFKINSVGFGSARPEAVHDYLCIPSTLNM